MSNCEYWSVGGTLLPMDPIAIIQATAVTLAGAAR
jgi:hypothetical protein